MNPAEYTQLCSPRLSHAARTLYWLFLRRDADQDGNIVVSYPELGRALAVEDPLIPGGFRYQVTASGLTELFNELMAAGLVKQQTSTLPSGHYHQCRLTLPLVLKQAPLLPIPSGAYPMYLDWRPDPEFSTLSKLCGLRTSDYDEDELGEFIAYWLGHPEKYATTHQWMLKFIRTLKALRYTKRGSDLAADNKPSKELYYQDVEPHSGPSQRAKEMMEQAAQLVGKNGDKDDL